MTLDTRMIRYEMERAERSEVCKTCFDAKIIDGALCGNCMGFGKVKPIPAARASEDKERVA